jgi:hypothetical protein
MSNSDDGKLEYAVDVAGAVCLGLFTALAAYAAYQAALWGGNQATAYTTAINLLGEANREMLRGVQDQAFDTTVWIENMKAAQAEKKAAEVAEAQATESPEASAAAEEEEDDGEELTPEQAAQELAEELAYAEDEPLAKKLHKVLQSRRELVAATKWAAEEHEKRTKKVPPAQRLELAKKLVEQFARSESIDAEYYEVLDKLGVADAEDTEIEAALAKDPAAKARIDQLEKDSLAIQAAIEAEMDKLAAPMFFESPNYVRNMEAKAAGLLAQGNKTFQDGQNFNGYGDRFTLATVFLTVSLFFAGLSPVMRHLSLKLALLAVGIVVAGGAVWYMVLTPFA